MERTEERDRRVHARAGLSLLVQVKVESLDAFMREHAVNLSAGGMFIRTESPHDVGSLIYLQFRLRDGQTLIEGLASVVHVNPPGHAAAGMGVEFVNLDSKSRTRIDEIVAERLG